MRSLILAAFLCACAGTPAPTGYSNTARHRYQLGLEALQDGDHLEAVKHLTYVKNKFAYSKYAALAELRIADSYFEQEKFIEAIDSYRLFMQGRPNHREVPFAMIRIAHANFEQRPSNFFLFPPSHEKDQAATRDALTAYRRYLQRFAEGEHAAVAKERVARCRGALADHELYVARFYLNDERPVSARGRLEGLVSGFSDAPEQWAEGAWLLVRVYADLGDKAKATETARTLIAKSPAHDRADDARAWLSD